MFTEVRLLTGAGPGEAPSEGQDPAVEPKPNPLYQWLSILLQDSTLTLIVISWEKNTKWFCRGKRKKKEEEKKDNVGRTMVPGFREKKHTTKGNSLLLTKAKLGMSYGLYTTKHEGN